MKYFTT